MIPDVQGSIIATLDSAAGALTKTGYLPYGQSAHPPSSFGYTAQRIDPETNGLYYYRTRHYSPVLGRFLQTDPTGAKGGINLYAYARNDPLNFGDETGKAPDAPSSTAGQNFNFSEQIDVPEEDEDDEGALAGSIRNVNPLGGTTNCVNCAAAADATLGGAPASALDSGPQSIFNLGTNWNPVSGPLQIGSILSQSGLWIDGNRLRRTTFGWRKCGTCLERDQQWWRHTVPRCAGRRRRVEQLRSVSKLPVFADAPGGLR